MAASAIAGLLVYAYQDDFKRMVRPGNANAEPRAPVSPEVIPPKVLTPLPKIIDCRLRSTDSTRRALAEFKNSASFRVAIYWLDFEGVEKYYFRLDPGQSLQEQTFVSHPWCIRNAETGEAVKAVVITEERQWINVE